MALGKHSVYHKTAREVAYDSELSNLLSTRNACTSSQLRWLNFDSLVHFILHETKVAEKDEGCTKRRRQREHRSERSCEDAITGEMLQTTMMVMMSATGMSFKSEVGATYIVRKAWHKQGTEWSSERVES